MLLISGSDAGQVNPFALTPVEREVPQAKQNSPVVYRYASMDELYFGTLKGSYRECIQNLCRTAGLTLPYSVIRDLIRNTGRVRKTVDFR